MTDPIHTRIEEIVQEFQSHRYDLDFGTIEAERFLHSALQEIAKVSREEALDSVGKLFFPPFQEKGKWYYPLNIKEWEDLKLTTPATQTEEKK